MGALVTGVDGEGDGCVLEGRQGANQFVGGIVALRGVAQTQGNAQGAVGEGGFHLAVELAVLVIRQGAVRQARRVRPEHAAAHQGAHVEGQRRQGGAVGRHGVGGGVALADDGGEIVQNLPAVGGAEGGGGHAAVAVDDGGEALAQLNFPKAGAQGRQVAVAVDVDEAGGHRHGGGVYRHGGVAIKMGADGGDDALRHRHVGGEAVLFRAVIDGAAPYQNVPHGAHLLLFYYSTAGGNGKGGTPKHPAHRNTFFYLPETVTPSHFT